jgi:hypothetical protein
MDSPYDIKVLLSKLFRQNFKNQWGQASVPAHQMSALLTPYF